MYSFFLLHCRQLDNSAAFAHACRTLRHSHARIRFVSLRGISLMAAFLLCALSALSRSRSLSVCCAAADAMLRSAALCLSLFVLFTVTSCGLTWQHTRCSFSSFLLRICSWSREHGTHATTDQVYQIQLELIK